jgi:hypothetical protein
MANEIFNAELDEIIPDGKMGNQALYAIFYRDRRGLFKRLTQAEGNEVALNPETEERNTIGMQQAKTVVRSYKTKFSKDIIIEKGDDNYEFFRVFYEKRYTGKDAELDMIFADFMQSVPAKYGKQRYKAQSFTCTVSVDTADWTGAKLSVSFDQAGEDVTGVADYDENTKSVVFTPSSNLPADTVNLSDTEIKISINEEKWVSVDFEPFGAPDGFKLVSSDPGVCTVSIRRDSAVITGVGAGEATVTVSDAATETVKETIAVSVE